MKKLARSEKNKTILKKIKIFNLLFKKILLRKLFVYK